MKKRLISILMIVTMLCGFTGWLPSDGDLFSISASAASSGMCGENVSWVLDDSGTLTISGTGSMANYSSSSSAPWNDNASDINRVIVGNGVTSIGNYAFASCGNLTSITIPNGVTSIGEDAFNNCKSITGIILPESVQSIGSWAFYFCTALKSINVPNSVTSIGYHAFH